MRSSRELARALNMTRLASSLTKGPRAFSTATDVQIAAGTPLQRPGRKAVIFAPAKTSMQSGNAQTIEGGGPHWRLHYEPETKWANPLIGWTSTSDHVETMARQLYFDTKEEAVAYAERHGVAYEVQEPKVASKARPKQYQGYGDLFSYKKYGMPRGGLISERKPGKK